MYCEYQKLCHFSRKIVMLCCVLEFNSFWDRFSNLENREKINVALSNDPTIFAPNIAWSNYPH